MSLRVGRFLAIQYGDERLEFEVESSSARESSIRIDIDSPRGIRVIAPVGASDSAVRAAVRRRAKWIWKYYQPHKNPVKRSRAVSGEEILYLGRRYVLKVECGADESVKLKGGRLIVRARERDSRAVMSAINGWFRHRAKEYFAKRISARYSPSFDKKTSPPKFVLRAMRRQWGSCSPSGKIVLNPLLISAPRACIDYVITHELCHLKHHDHGPAFYRLLKAQMPDWEEQKSLLELIAPQILSSLLTRDT
ncbi:MAG: SprT family zinc-dependent metalloprotease [Sedimenticola sp.]